MDLYVIQFIQNKQLNGFALSKEEEEFLNRYKQANDDLFTEWLEVNY